MKISRLYPKMYNVAKIIGDFMKLFDSLCNFFRPVSISTQLTHDVSNNTSFHGVKYSKISFSKEPGKTYEISYAEPNNIEINANFNGKNKKVTLVNDQAKKIVDHITNMGNFPILPLPPFKPFKPLTTFEDATVREKLMKEYHLDLENYEKALVSYQKEKSLYNQKISQYNQRIDELNLMVNNILNK